MVAVGSVPEKLARHSFHVSAMRSLYGTGAELSRSVYGCVVAVGDLKGVC